MELELHQLLLGLLGAALVGLGKGGLPGVGNLTVVIFAMIFPAKASVGILLPVLICADVVAVIIYRQHALWKYIVKLFPWTAAGVLVGYFTMDMIDNAEVKKLIGGVLLGMTAIHFYRKHRLRNAEEAEDKLPHTLWFVAATGMIGGFATMVANAAGPVAALFFLAVGLPKMGFIGTGAWFFLLINCFKVPFQMDLGLISFDSIGTSLALAPAAVLGAIAAPYIVRRINQKVFENLIWLFIVAAGLKMIF